MGCLGLACCHRDQTHDSQPSKGGLMVSSFTAITDGTIDDGGVFRAVFRMDVRFHRHEQL